MFTFVYSTNSGSSESLFVCHCMSCPHLLPFPFVLSFYVVFYCTCFLSWTPLVMEYEYGRNCCRARSSFSLTSGFSTTGLTCWSEAQSSLFACLFKNNEGKHAQLLSDCHEPTDCSVLSERLCLQAISAHKLSSFLDWDSVSHSIM